MVEEITGLDMGQLSWWKALDTVKGFQGLFEVLRGDKGKHSLRGFGPSEVARGFRDLVFGLGVQDEAGQLELAIFWDGKFLNGGKLITREKCLVSGTENGVGRRFGGIAEVFVQAER